jgi:hypothetical protein
MEKPMTTPGTLLVAALATVAATVLALHEAYNALTRIDGVTVPHETIARSERAD